MAFTCTWDYHTQINLYAVFKSIRWDFVSFENKSWFKFVLKEREIKKKVRIDFIGIFNGNSSFLKEMNLKFKKNV